MTRPLVIGHRGDPSRALENSLESFRLALSVPVDMIEFDVRKSRDNGLYVMHDRDTGRTCNGNIDIERASREEIERVRLRNGERIPTLADVLDLVSGKAGLNIEVKSRGAGALCAAELARTGFEGQLLLSSFKEGEVEAMRRLLPKTPVAGIFDAFSPSEVGPYARMGYSAISLNRKTVTPELVERCRERGIEVFVWTADEEADMRTFRGWNVAGICSNRPELLRKVVDEGWDVSGR